MRERLNYIDSAKGIGILLVILGHTYGIPDSIHNIIYSFHMPLFFIIAGMLYDEEKYNNCSFKQMLIKRANDYLKPYFIFALINLVLTIGFDALIKNVPFSIERIKSYTCGILYCYADVQHMPNCSPIWFLMCLFIAIMSYWSFMKYAKKCIGIIAVGALLTSWVLSLLVEKRLPWNISSAFMAIFFLYVGNCIKKYNLVQYKWLALSAIVGVVSALYNGDKVGMNQNAYGNILLFLLASISLSLLVLIACKNFNILQKGIWVWIGKNTLLIIGFNYFMRDFTTEIYYLVPIVRKYPIHWCVSFLITTIGLIILISAWNKLKNIRLSS